MKNSIEKKIIAYICCKIP